MSDFWRPFGALLPAGLIAGGLLVGLAFTWRRLAGAGRRLTAVAFCIVWALATLAVTLRPQPALIDAQGNFRTRELNLVPFRELWIITFDSTTWHVFVEQVAGNTVLFAPLGAGLALLTYRRPRARVGFLGGAIAGVVVECLQWMLGTGRISSIDDVLLATLGSGLGFLVSRRYVTVHPRSWSGPAKDGAKT
jgi:glycopeptide antibiotics resistance protein